MKCIGLIGGLSWQSTVEYYRAINSLVAARLGGSASARINLQSLNFAEMKAHADAGRWDEVGELILNAAKRLDLGGADCLLICTNTLHKFAPLLREKVNLPLIHIAEEVASEVKKRGMKKVGLLGTRHTMRESFYYEVLKENGVAAIGPNEDEIVIIDDIIFEELVDGTFTVESAKKYLQVMETLRSRGAEGMILGCTEIPILMREVESELVMFDTTQIHSEAAVRFSLS